MLTPVSIARSGFIASGNVGWPHLASGAVRSGDLGITGGTPTGTNFLRDDFTWSAPGAASVTSGAVAQNTFASGAGPEYLMPFVSGLTNPFPVITEETVSGVRAVSLSQSGNLRVAMASMSGRIPAIGVVLDNVASGIAANVYAFGNFQVTSGLADYSGFVGTQLFVGRSGQIVSVSGSFNSGGLLSGDVTQPIATAVNSGAFQLAIATNLPVVLGLITSGMIASGSLDQFLLASGAVSSGQVASGAIQGFFGATRDIASGTVGVFDLGSGAVAAGNVGSGAVQGSLGTLPNIASGTIGTNDIGSGGVQSGNILSGNVGRFALSSGCVNGALTASQHVASGTLGAADVASGAIRGDASTIVGHHIASGTVGKINLASGILTSGIYIGSGTILGQAGGGPFNIASGTITTNDIGSGAVVSGLVASGQIGSYAGGSGTCFDRSQYVLQFVSGLNRGPNIITEEIVSGVRAVALSQSGNVRVAMASVSGRMPAIGVVVDNVASGIPANVYVVGDFQLGSGLADYSGYLGQLLFVGRSGQIVSSSGSFNSGGLLSGDIVQPVGTVVNSGSPSFTIAAMPPFVPSLIYSGNIGSGQIGGSLLASGAITSGVVIGSGALWGQPNGGPFLIASGTIGTNEIGSGAIQSGRVASGQLGAFHHASGYLTSGFWVGSGAIWGRAGVNQFMICSGTIANFDIASGGVLSGNIASGQIGPNHLASGIITSGFWVGSGSIMGHAGGGPFQVVSGSITTADIGSGAITSGQIASGQVGQFALASGSVLQNAYSSGTGPQYVLNFASGENLNAIITQETVSGVRAVCISTSGHIAVAMASQSGRMPAVGVVFDNVASGIQCNVFIDGTFTTTSGLSDFSGYLGQTLWVGRSGQVVTTSGSWNSGGLLSGDVWQPLGTVALTSGGINLTVDVSTFTVGQITSGNIASGQIGSTHIASGGVLSGNIGSGQVGTYAHASGTTVTDAMNVTPLWSGNAFKQAICSEPISGIKAVCVDITNSGAIRTAMAAQSGRMPAIGVVADNVASGIAVNVISVGYIPFGSGIMASGFLQGKTIWVGFSGDLITLSGGYGSGGSAVLSGFMGQQMGEVHFTASGRTSGAYLVNTSQVIFSGIPLVGQVPALYSWNFG